MKKALETRGEFPVLTSVPAYKTTRKSYIKLSNTFLPGISNRSTRELPCECIVPPPARSPYQTLGGTSSRCKPSKCESRTSCRECIPPPMQSISAPGPALRPCTRQPNLAHPPCLLSLSFHVRKQLGLYTIERTAPTLDPVPPAELASPTPSKR